MQLYLVQHGRALSSDEDPARPLSPEGRATTERVARHLAACGRAAIDPPLTEIRHSGKLRAEQTAGILAANLATRLTPVATDDLNPNDDPQTLYRELSAARERPDALVLVGHLPHLARLAGILLAGNPERAPIRVQNSGVLKIVSAEADWVVEWYLAPGCVP